MQIFKNCFKLVVTFTAVKYMCTLVGPAVAGLVSMSLKVQLLSRYVVCHMTQVYCGKTAEARIMRLSLEMS